MKKALLGVVTATASAITTAPVGAAVMDTAEILWTPMAMASAITTAPAGAAAMDAVPRADAASVSGVDTADK